MPAEGKTAAPRRQREEVDRNYEAFQALLPGLLETDAGRAALMRDGKLVECFDTDRDAFLAGRAMFADGLFSVQRVSDRPVNLGWFSYVGGLWPVRSEG